MRISSAKVAVWPNARTEAPSAIAAMTFHSTLPKRMSSSFVGERSTFSASMLSAARSWTKRRTFGTAR
ncbi:MAG: hypothetical protein V9F04_13975 [Dermatophilaceae bacterium]